MAGRKKQPELTAEEKLQQALVPEAEQPYKVPDNWCWTRLGNVTEIIMGQSPDGKSITDDKTFMPLIGGAADMGEEFPIIKRYTKEPTKICTEKDLIICIRATLGRPIYSNGTYCLGRGVAALRSIESKREFYKYFFLTFEQYLFEKATGTTFAQISSNILKNMPVPFPPLAEQQRIVERIENLFAKLDEAKEKLQNTLDTFETRKAAILHKAFTGELTANWRKQHGLTMDSWEEKTLGEVAFVTKLAGFEYTKNIFPNLCDEGIPLFKGKNIQKNELVLEFESYIPESVSNELIRSQLNRKCILTPYVGTIGNVAIFNGDFKAHLGSNVGKIEINKDTFEEFVAYYLRSDFGYKELTKQKKATAQESISIKAIREVIVKIPTFDEQTEIVRIIDNLLAKEQQAYSIAQNALAQIDLIKKSILARAFRGQLATNNPADEPAIELLKRVL